MRPRLALVAGGAALVGSVVVRVWKGRRPSASEDPADELRRKLDESRALTDEREEFESAETPVDQAEPGLDARRRSVHEQAKGTIEEMRGDES
jgi:hypothetical protein